jgi:hypothetical protein
VDNELDTMPAKFWPEHTSSRSSRRVLCIVWPDAEDSALALGQAVKPDTRTYIAENQKRGACAAAGAIA